MARLKVQHERDKVLRPCLKAGKMLVRQGALLGCKRLSELDVDHEPGEPDIELRFIKDATLWIIQVECKKPGGGHHRDTQKAYRDKYELAHNVVYVLIESVEEFEKLVEEHTQFFTDRLKKIDIDF